jgi:hypothetical protein
MLDPSRFALNAATVGFRKRTHQSVDWGAFNNAIQNQTDAINVRRELGETAISELHVMGGERFGIAGNEKTNTAARQARQMNGYPLRSFLATGGAIILPPKHGEGLMMTPMNMGLTQYAQYNGVVGNYVSSFTEPLNAPLENQSILLARAGIKARSESASDPFKALQFMMNMHSKQQEINDNARGHENLRGYNQQGSLADSVGAMEAPMAAAAKKRRFDDSVSASLTRRSATGAPQNMITPSATSSAASSVASTPRSQPSQASRPIGPPPLTAGKKASQQPPIANDLHTALTQSVNRTHQETTRNEDHIAVTIENHNPVLESLHNDEQMQRDEQMYNDMFDELSSVDKDLFNEAMNSKLEAMDHDPTQAEQHAMSKELFDRYRQASGTQIAVARQNHHKRQQNIQVTDSQKAADNSVSKQLFLESTHQEVTLSDNFSSFVPALNMARQETVFDKRQSKLLPPIQTEVEKSYSFAPSTPSFRAQQDGNFSGGTTISQSGGERFGNASVSPESRVFDQGYSPTLETLASPSYYERAKIALGLGTKLDYSGQPITSPSGNKPKSTYKA